MQENDLITKLSELNLCEIVPCEGISANDMQNSLNLTPYQTSQISAFVSHLPELTSANTLAKAYTVKMPKGVTGELMKYKSGGVGTPILGENGKIVGHASLQDLSQSAVVMSAFSVIAVASSQYYLKEINDEFKMLNQKIDNILDFLYGDKKSELVSEICFVQHACKNFASIMEHDEQRAATIVSLQSAQKTAMKDIEFYLSDLNDKSETNVKNYSEFETLLKEIFKIKDSLEMSMQLYAMTNIMEVHYSQNYDENYIADIKDTTVYYINKCERQILSVFSKLAAENKAFKGNKLNKIDTTPLGNDINNIISSLNIGDDSKLNVAVNSTFDALNEDSTFRIDKKGQVYKVI